MRTLLSFFIIGFLFSNTSVFSAPSSSERQLIERVEASVNGQLILISDLSKFRTSLNLRGQLDPLFSGTSLATKGTNITDQEIVQFLVNEHLIQEEFEISDTEVEQEINSIQATNQIDRNTLTQALNMEGYSFQDYFEMIRVSIAKRNLIDRDIRTKAFISDDDVKNYYFNQIVHDSHLEYHTQIIVIDPSRFRNEQLAIDTAQRALEQIRSGESFEEVAQRFSSGPNASRGGDLGFLAERSMSPQIREGIQGLSVGGVSEVIGSSSSRMMIVRLKDVRSGKEDQFEREKEKIRNALAAKEYQRQIELWLDRKRQKAMIRYTSNES
jgi:peptidyl-prolyl cis-trans isomerase SurA